MPSERTLRDYTHLFKADTGIQDEVTKQLMQEAGVVNLEEWKKYVVVLFDEVKIKEDLVFNKHTCEIVGFVDLGNVNNQLGALAESADTGSFNPDRVATHMLVFMVRGLFIKFEFPYAHAVCHKNGNRHRAVLHGLGSDKTPGMLQPEGDSTLL